MDNMNTNKNNVTVKGGSVGHPGLVDPTNLGLALGSTSGDATSPAMTIGGTADFPIQDAGVSVETPDLSAEALKGGKRPAKDDKKKMYNVVEVIGSSVPSENAKYTGPTPSMALNKAARRIHKKNPGQLEFSVLMRKVSPKHAERELYMYDVKMVKAPKAQGFVTFEVNKFDDTNLGLQTAALKKVRIIQASDQPVFGYVDTNGKGVKDKDAKDKDFKLVRTPGTNTLSLVVPGDLPFKIYDLTVVRTEWSVTSERNSTIAKELRDKYDTASHAREREAKTLQIKKERDSKKKEVEKARAKAAQVKEHTLKMKANARARAAEKKERDAQVKFDKAQKAKAKAEKAKASTSKAGSKVTSAKPRLEAEPVSATTEVTEPVPGPDVVGKTTPIAETTLADKDEPAIQAAVGGSSAKSKATTSKATTSKGKTTKASLGKANK